MVNANGKNCTCPKMSGFSSHSWLPGGTVYRKESIVNYGRASHPQGQVGVKWIGGPENTYQNHSK